MKTTKELEDELIRIQNRYRKARKPEAREVLRREYRRLHSRWVAQKNQGTL